ncbi:MAG: hypothetical protein ACYTGV_08210 [Planctomycetota bacterium]
MVLDVADPKNPQVFLKIKTWDHANAVAVSGNYIFVADDDEGVKVYRWLHQVSLP